MDEPTRHWFKIVDTDGEVFSYYVDTEAEADAITVAAVKGLPFIVMNNAKGRQTLINTAHIMVATRITEADL